MAPKDSESDYEVDKFGRRQQYCVDKEYWNKEEIMRGLGGHYHGTKMNIVSESFVNCDKANID